MIYLVILYILASECWNGLMAQACSHPKERILIKKRIHVTAVESANGAPKLGGIGSALREGFSANP